MGKLAILFKLLLVALGFVLFGFGLLCWITDYLATSYGGGVGAGVATEFAKWGLSFMLSLAVQLCFIFGGLFIAAMCIYSILNDFDYCRGGSSKRRR